MIYYLLGLCCLSIAYFYLKGVTDAQNANARSHRYEEIRALKGFEVTLSYISTDARTAIAISEHNLQMAIFNRSVGWRELAFGDLISIAIAENDKVVLSPSPADRTANAINGALLFGAAGAIAGATSDLRKVNKLDLRLTVDDLKSPIIDINFLTTISPVYSTSAKYEQAFKDASLWQARLEAGRLRSAKSAVLRDLVTG